MAWVSALILNFELKRELLAIVNTELFLPSIGTDFAKRQAHAQVFDYQLIMPNKSSDYLWVSTLSAPLRANFELFFELVFTILKQSQNLRRCP